MKKRLYFCACVTQKFIETMKKKIIEALKTEFKELGLSDKTIDRLASYVEGLVEKEEDIATAVKRDDVKLIATSIQGEIDGLRKAKKSAEDALEEYKKSHPDKKTGKDDDNNDDDNDDDDEDGKDSKGMKMLLEKYAELEERLNRRDKEEKDKATIASVKSALKKAGCTNETIIALIMKGFALGENEKEEDAVTRLKGEYDKSVKDLFGDGVVPFSGDGNRTPAEVSEADRIAKAKEDAKRVRENQ